MNGLVSSSYDEEVRTATSNGVDRSEPTDTNTMMSPLSSNTGINPGTIRQVSGTVLEAAFVDPAYMWPPEDGVGSLAIELQATEKLLEGVDHDAAQLAKKVARLELEQQKKREAEVSAAVLARNDVRGGSAEEETVTREVRFGGCFACCRDSSGQVDARADGRKSKAATPKEDDLSDEEEEDEDEDDPLAADMKSIRSAPRSTRELEDRTRYSRVPEGILVYRLDTRDNTIELLSPPHQNTDVESLLTYMVVNAARPGTSSRREVVLTGLDGQVHSLEACEQRTAISWLEAIEMMLSRDDGQGFMGSKLGRNKNTGGARAWEKEGLSEGERGQAEHEYLNLAAYSNVLIRSGAQGPQSDSSPTKGTTNDTANAATDNPSTPGGIYYSVETKVIDGEGYDDETLESIARRRAVIKDSWDFFRMVCSLIRDRRKYVEAFRRLTTDPLYPYLNSIDGLNDPEPGEGSKSRRRGENLDGSKNTGEILYAPKIISQRRMEDYGTMTRVATCKDLISQAERALPSLVEICKALAGSLGLEEVGVGPIKEVSAILRKADMKYDKDVLRVTDICRSLLVVKDIATLLALLELARDSFGPLIKRVKLSSFKERNPHVSGGYRHCIINLELKDHICEIQIHLWPFWMICGVDGFRHYRHCAEYSTDSFEDPFDALEGLDRKTRAELIVMAEEAVSPMPLEKLQWYHEKYILDYFAEAGLFIKHGLSAWGEVTLRHLIRLRCESPDIGMDHHETRQLQRYLARTLNYQKKVEESDEILERLKAYEDAQKTKDTEEQREFWDTIYDFLDPSKKEREQEEKVKHEVRASKRHWRKIRAERFRFLDNNDQSAPMQ
eukprot:CAMPEP_0113297168 /NCGR_PEP_ID=MMETSP0010_2-20120614/143_1 /TAXON_ID=216773 ORGANISM="Corethron hystrix, Strain 308" /NCGR_SAMPLE_ID=MMETSP0010_2 /ASSEMBLY_ACC=CAM_ASM_000155 /LENGTH=840 /DNA_ID=CAMNT_0000150013 /DNA_START=155 /DNA_END=2677 /DNA_ORIENTATION=- /assembly_acc=CAM_ASM_000155